MLSQTEKEYVTAGGIPIYTMPASHLHSFSLSLYVKGGAIFETGETCGISHFIEHLIFRSINRYMDGALYPTLDRLGLSVEGITYREFLQFTVTGAPAHFADAARILTYALLPLNLTAEDIRTERSRVIAEIREEGERTSLDFFTDGILFGDHPLARPITGTGTTLARMTRTRLEAERKTLFSKENSGTKNAVFQGEHLLLSVGSRARGRRDGPCGFGKRDSPYKSHRARQLRAAATRIFSP